MTQISSSFIQLKIRKNSISALKEKSPLAKHAQNFALCDL